MNFGEWDAGSTSLQLPCVVSDGERRPDGTFGIVLVSSRNAEDRHEARGVPETDQWSCCAFVFVDQAAEEIAAVDLFGGWRSSSALAR
jgi:hypothetical protein